MILRSPRTDLRRNLACAVLLSCAWLSAPSAARADREACIAAHEEAQLMRLRGRYTAARESLLQCAQSTCPALISNDCIGWLAEIDASLPTVVFAVNDANGRDLIDVRVTAGDTVLTEQLDGRALPLDPGVYTLRFEAPGYEPAEQVVTIREAQKQRLIRIELVRLATSRAATSDARAASPARIASYALGIGALGVAGAGLTLGVLGKRELDRLERTCGDEGCSRAERAHGKGLYIAADVAFGVSAGLAIAAAWLFIADHKRSNRDRPARTSQLAASLHPAAPWLGWRTQF